MKPRLPLAVSSLLGLATLGALAGCPAAPVDPGDPGPLVSRTDAIQPGTTCPVGGSTVLVGHDTNHNGVLDDREIESTTTVCREDRPETLVRVDPEPAGAHCASGGSAVRTGPDQNHDGRLEDDEVQSTTYACDPQAVFHGDFTAAMWDDPAQVALLAQAQVVTGSIDASGAPALALPRLELVGGDLRVEGHMTASIDVGALTTVGGDLLVSDPTLVGRIGFPRLAEVDGSVAWNAPSVTAVSAPALASIGGGLGAYASELGELDLPALTSIGGSLGLISLPNLDVALPALTTIGGSLFLEDDAQLVSLDGLAALTSIAHDVVIGGNDALTSVALPKLASFGGNDMQARMRITGASLQVVGLPALTFARDLDIGTSPSLVSISAPVLFNVGRLRLVGDPALTHLDLGKLANAWSSGSVTDDAIDIENTGLTALSLPSLFESYGAIEIRRNPALTEVRFDGLFKTESLHVVDDPQVAVVAAPILGIGPASLSIGEIEIDGAPVRELSLANVATISRRVSLRGTQLADLKGLAGLTSAYRLQLVDNAALASLDGLAKLASAHAVTVTGSPALSPDEIAALIARVTGK